MIILSIDIGIHHLGYVYADINQDYTLNKILECDLLNIQTFPCNQNICNLHHEECFSDYISHLFQTHYNIFESSDIILIEQQPPTGFIVIQELIRYNYRYKTITIHPSSMHSHFGINHLDYENRKLATEQIASRYLSDFKSYVFQTRHHDIADSMCQLLFFLYKKNNEYTQEQIRLFALDRYKDTIMDIELLKYNPNDPIDSYTDKLNRMKI